MITVYALKPGFQAFLRPLCRRLARRGIRPNQVTWAAILLSAAVGSLVAAWPTRLQVLLLLPVALFARMALNALDGMLAREHGMRTPQGAVLNEVGDVVSDALMYLPLGFVPGVSAAWVVVAVVLGAATEVAGLVGPQLGAERSYSGPCGKSDRALGFGALALALGCGVEPGAWVTALLVAITALCGCTIVRRARTVCAEAA